MVFKMEKVEKVLGKVEEILGIFEVFGEYKIFVLRFFREFQKIKEFIEILRHFLEIKKFVYFIFWKVFLNF